MGKPIPSNFGISRHESIVAGGGLVKNNLLMQIYADIIGRDITVSASPQVSALGAAMLASVAAGKENSGHANLKQAAANTASGRNRLK